MYDVYRPKYPPAMFKYIAEYVQQKVCTLQYKGEIQGWTLKTNLTSVVQCGIAFLNCVVTFSKVYLSNTMILYLIHSFKPRAHLDNDSPTEISLLTSIFWWHDSLYKLYLISSPASWCHPWNWP